MSRTAVTSLFRPFICRDCRNRLATSRPTLRRSAHKQGQTPVRTRGDWPETISTIDNQDQVNRRIDQLGGLAELKQLYRHVEVKPGERLLSPVHFEGDFKRSRTYMPKHVNDQESVVLYGRVKTLRRLGRRLAFIDVEIGGEMASVGASAQAMFNLGSLMELDKSMDNNSLDRSVQRLRRGDWISMRGNPEVNDKGKFQLRASELPQLLSPTLQTIPLKLEDAAFRMRNRHADQIVNPEQRDIIFIRSMLLNSFRKFMLENKFIEVNTPLIVANAGGAAARPFETEATEFQNQILNLRVAPELFLKRMIIGGMQRVYELGPAFRNEGVDNTHNPEFTIAEFYGIMLTLDDLMRLTEKLFKTLANCTRQAAEKLETVSEPEINFTPPFPVIEFIPGLEAAIRAQIPDWTLPDLEREDVTMFLQQTYEQLDMQMPAQPTLSRLLDGLSARFLEPQCQSPTFIIHQPECMAPLARSFEEPASMGGSSVSHRVSARAELFIQGQEFVNCYEEEHSPIEQRRKFEAQLEASANEDDLEAPKGVDRSYLAALEWGMPPTGGWGCGVDRIVMLFGGKSRIADVLPFGTLRNVVGLGSQMKQERTHAQSPARTLSRAQGGPQPQPSMLPPKKPDRLRYPVEMDEASSNE